MATDHQHPSRTEIEDFLYDEAALLDNWRLEEWFALFLEGATYEVPSADAAEDARSDTTLFYIADDYIRLHHRVERLKNKEAHSEFPRSRGFRMIGNVRLLPAANGELTVNSKFLTKRSRDDTTDTYFGHHQHRLLLRDGQIKIAAKRTTLESSSLRPQGRVSIIL